MIDQVNYAIDNKNQNLPRTTSSVSDLRMSPSEVPLPPLLEPKIFGMIDFSRMKGEN